MSTSMVLASRGTMTTPGTLHDPQIVLSPCLEQTHIDGDNNELSRYYHMLMHFMYETSFNERGAKATLELYVPPRQWCNHMRFQWVRRYTKYLPVILKHGNGKLMDISPIKSPIINWNHNNDYISPIIIILYYSNIYYLYDNSFYIPYNFMIFHVILLIPFI
jgi:hypothetical protein